MNEQPPRIYTGLEEEGRRGRTGVEYQFNKGIGIGYDKENPPELDVDKLLTASCTEALRSGKSKLRLLDFGSGQTGAFIFSFSEEESYPELYSFLKNHPEFKIDIVGFTSLDTQGEVVRAQNVELGSQVQISITNYSYTVTRAHTVQKFLDEIANSSDHNKFDLVFATWSLGYLQSASFAKAVEDIINNIDVGGNFYCSAYHAVDPGFERTFLGTQELRITESSEYSYLQRSWEFDELDPDEKRSLVSRYINLILKLNPKLEEEVEKAVYKSFLDSRYLLEENKLRRMAQGLKLKRTKNKFLKRGLRDLTTESLPIELFDQTFLWRSVLSSLSRILQDEIRSRNDYSSRKKKVIEHIGELEGFDVEISDCAFIISKTQDTNKVEDLGEIIRQ